MTSRATPWIATALFTLTAGCTQQPGDESAGSPPQVSDLAGDASLQPTTSAEMVAAKRVVGSLRADFRVQSGADSVQLVSAPQAIAIDDDGGRLVPRFQAGPSGPNAPSRAQVRLPKHADEPFSLSASGVQWEVRLLDAEPTPGISAGDAVVYEGVAAGATLVHVPLPDGTEDHVRFDRRPERRELAYEVQAQGAAGYRLVDGVLELLTSNGNPVMRTTAPWVLDSQGALRRGGLSLEGCRYDSDGRLPWGREVTSPGADRCVVVASWDDSGLAYPLLVDPAWSLTDRLAQQRTAHRASSLISASGRRRSARATAAGSAPPAHRSRAAHTLATAARGATRAA